jgi:hypothetical protein
MPKRKHPPFNEVYPHFDAALADVLLVAGKQHAFLSTIVQTGTLTGALANSASKLIEQYDEAWGNE